MSGDCAAGVCTSGSTSSCKDGVKNGAETDVDCGGPVCPTCATGKACAVASDCTSGDCAAGVCASGAAPSCTDGIENGTETDVDCGGGTCAPCAEGKSCLVNADCIDDTCHAGTCMAPAPKLCADGIKDGNETDIDCGGGTCPPCSIARSCKANADCASNACDALTLVCAASQCTDQLQDGSETDVDCGGGVCPSCSIGKKCKVDSDCTSNACDAAHALLRRQRVHRSPEGRHGDRRRLRRRRLPVVRRRQEVQGRRRLHVERLRRAHAPLRRQRVLRSPSRRHGDRRRLRRRRLPVVLRRLEVQGRLRLHVERLRREHARLRR